MPRVQVFMLAAFGAACLLAGTPASAWGPQSATLGDVTPINVQQVASSTYYTRKAAARTATIKADTRRTAYQAQTKRYETRKAYNREVAKREQAARDLHKRRNLVGRGVLY